MVWGSGSTCTTSLERQLGKLFTHGETSCALCLSDNLICLAMVEEETLLFIFALQLKSSGKNLWVSGLVVTITTGAAHVGCADTDHC